jgi:hypothetical protein
MKDERIAMKFSYYEAYNLYSYDRQFTQS